MKAIKQTLFLILPVVMGGFLALTWSCKKEDPETLNNDGNSCIGMPTITDERDNNTYNTVQIGEQMILASRDYRLAQSPVEA